MQINSFSSPNQTASSISDTNINKLKTNQPAVILESKTQQQFRQYDVHNMSTRELENLTTELRESGQISETDSMMLAVDRLHLEAFGGISKDTKIDMVDFFQKQIDFKNSTPGSKGVEYQERSLSILKTVEAKNGSNIPLSV